MTRTPPVTTGWALALALALGVVVLAALPPFVGFQAGALVRQGFAPLCHQIVERSPHAHGVPFALCHRCFGIVSGVLAGVLAGPLVPAALARLARASAPRTLAVAALPTAVDWLLGASGLWANTGTSRLATGALFGVAAGLLLAAAALVPSRLPISSP